MIKTPTAIIIGAGAGVPYTFPTGPQLRSKIINFVRANGMPELAAIRSVAEEPLQLKGLVDALSMAPHLSVDALIESRPELKDIGKLSIAAALLPLERTAHVIRAKEDWIGFLLNQMRALDESISSNNVSFITFNYDRVLEHRLTVTLATMTGRSHMDAWEVVQRIPIVHVYGQLGRYEPLGETPKADDVVLFGDFLIGEDPISPRRIRTAADGIHLIDERDQTPSGFEQAHSLIREAEQIIFLGFGFDQTNLRRLLPASREGARPRVYGSAYMLRSGQVQAAQSTIADLLSPVRESGRRAPRRPGEIKLVDLTALDTLREYAHVLT